MTERTVQIGMCTYTDVSGARRIGQAGETVDVHPDDLARFGRLNGIIEVQAPSKPAPAKKRVPKKRVSR